MHHDRNGLHLNSGWLAEVILLQVARERLRYVFVFAEEAIEALNGLWDIITIHVDVVDVPQMVHLIF